VNVTYGAQGTYAVTLTDGRQTRASRTVQCTIAKRRLRCVT
jgi:hypothetical protein